MVNTRTLHISFEHIDRADVFLYCRQWHGFELLAFYDKFCFVRFHTPQSATAALLGPKREGMTLEAAKHTYELPYPQPEEPFIFCSVLHVTHLPANYTRIEMGKMFSWLEG